jgi:hypothetical protein
MTTQASDMPPSQWIAGFLELTWLMDVTDNKRELIAKKRRLGSPLVLGFEPSGHGGGLQVRSLAGSHGVGCISCLFI